MHYENTEKTLTTDLTKNYDAETRTKNTMTTNKQLKKKKILNEATRIGNIKALL